MGSMASLFAGAAKRVDPWRHEWEAPYVVGSADRIFANTFDQIERDRARAGRARHAL